MGESEKLESGSGEGLVVGRHGFEVAVFSKDTLGARKLSPALCVEVDPCRAHGLFLGNEVILVNSF